MIEARATGNRFLGNGTPNARPNICPTQVPPDLGYSLTTYSGIEPESKRTIPVLATSLDHPERDSRTPASTPPRDAASSSDFERGFLYSDTRTFIPRKGRNGTSRTARMRPA